MIQFAPPPTVADTKLRTLVASDDEQVGQRIRALLLNHRPDGVAHCVVPIELVAERVAHLNPSLIIVALPADIQRAFRVMREVSRSLPAPLLAVGPVDDPKLILRTLHEGGATEYLDETRLDDEIGAALMRFRSRQRSPPARDRGRVLSVVAPSGGSGGSTIAVNLAVVLAARHHRCALVDLRLTAGDLAPLLDIQPEYGLTDLCANLDRLDRQMFDQFFMPHDSGVRLLAAPRDPTQAGQVTPRGVRQAVAMARNEFPHVVIDVDNVLDEHQIEAVWQSDAVLLVLRLDYTSLRNVRRTMEHLHQKGMDPERIQLVANRVGERNQLTVPEAEQALGQSLFDQLPNEPPRINAAINAGVPVVLHRPRARVARRLAALAVRIAEHGARQTAPAPDLGP